AGACRVTQPSGADQLDFYESIQRSLYRKVSGETGHPKAGSGETLHFDCISGYATDGSYETQCQPGGTWDPPPCPAGCSLQQEQRVQAEPPPGWALTHQCSIAPTPFPLCPPPPGIANGKHSGQLSDTHLPGSTVQYSCRDGYSLVGNTSISCTAEGTWSRPQPRCEGPTGRMLQCPSPPNIKNGQHDSKDVKAFIPGTSVKYYCDPGYVLTGKTTVSCLTSGTWSIPYPRCEGELSVLLLTVRRATIVVAQPSLDFDLVGPAAAPRAPVLAEHPSCAQLTLEQANLPTCSIGMARGEVKPHTQRPPWV
uniref:Sushi domain-containing protein n=1 Tax=Falco tinnunculus TaxID=100819 RepID=A0A8C4U143_FALTI